MSNLKELISLISSLGVRHINDRLEEEVSDIKKTALLVYICNLVINLLSTIFILGLLLGTIHYFPDLKLNFSYMSVYDYFTIALFSFFLIAMILIIVHFLNKPTPKPEPEINKNEIISKLLPLVENLAVTYVESKINSDNKSRSDEIASLKIENQDLKNSLNLLKNEIKNHNIDIK